MDRYQGAIFHLVNRMVFSEDDAEDLTIETFTKAFKRLHQYTPAFAFSTWLFKIASNHTIDFIRKKRINALPRPWVQQRRGRPHGNQRQGRRLGPMEALQKQERIERMREVVSQLKDRYRGWWNCGTSKKRATKKFRRNSTCPGHGEAQLFRARDMMAKVLESSRETI